MEKQNKRPNVVFIMTDHQREDSIGMIQSGVEVTPNLNRLAMQSLIFNKAYDTCPLCVPARTALATGKYPTRNGVTTNDWKGLTAQNHKPIHQYLDEAGYEVAHIGVHHIRVKPTLEERVNFVKWIEKTDYDKYAASKGIDVTPSPEHRSEVFEQEGDDFFKKRYSNAKTAVWQHDMEDFKDYYFGDKSVDFIKQEHNAPFALFTYFWAPHPPLIVPEPYASLFDPDKIDLPDNVGVTAENEPADRRKGVPAQLAENIDIDHWRRVWAAHLGLVNFADAQIGRMLDALEQTGQMENTIIVFTSDHGEHLGQHRMYQKMEMYEQAINVPLIMKVPNINSKKINALISHLDLVPTLLEMTGTKYDSKEFDGISLCNLINEGTQDENRKVFCQYSGNPVVGAIRRAVITKRYKYIYDPRDDAELYDLKNDPFEMINLAKNDKYKEIVKELHDECKKWAETHNDWVKF